MATTTDQRIFDQLLDKVGRCLTPEVSERIAALRATARVQERLDELADKNTEGKLTPDEEAEYESYVEALDVIAILQAKARQRLKV